MSWCVSELFLGTHGASCAEPSEARLRAADESVISFVIVKASEGSEGEDELQSASLLPRCVKRCFVFIHFTRFPFLLSQVSTFVVKPMKTIHFGSLGGPKRASLRPSKGVLWGFPGALREGPLGPLWELRKLVFPKENQ